MSVMSCGRYYCDNIMCDRLVLESSLYICDECYSELLAYKETWPEKMSKGEVREKIEAFMDTKRGTYRKIDRKEIDEEFDRLMG